MGPLGISNKTRQFVSQSGFRHKLSNFDRPVNVVVCPDPSDLLLRARILRGGLKELTVRVMMMIGDRTETEEKEN